MSLQSACCGLASTAAGSTLGSSPATAAAPSRGGRIPSIARQRLVGAHQPVQSDPTPASGLATASMPATISSSSSAQLLARIAGDLARGEDAVGLGLHLLGKARRVVGRHAPVRDQRVVDAHEVADRQHALLHRLVGRQRRKSLPAGGIDPAGLRRSVGARARSSSAMAAMRAIIMRLSSRTAHSRESSSFTLAASCGSEKGLGRKAKFSSPSAALKASLG